MGTTPTYGLPWPEESDPSDLPTQQRASMEAVEAALILSRKLPDIPTAYADGVDQSALPGASVAATTKWTNWHQLGTAIVTPTATSWSWARSGVYSLYAKVSCNYATLSSSSYAQLVGSGSPLTGMQQLQPWSRAWCDVEFAYIVPVTAAQVGVACNLTCFSNPADTYSIIGSKTQIFIKRLGDIEAVTTPPGG